MSHVDQNDNSHLDPNRDSISFSKGTDKSRLIVAILAVVLATLSFAAYLYTGNASILAGTSPLVYPMYKVVDYYFVKDK